MKKFIATACMFGILTIGNATAQSTDQIIADGVAHARQQHFCSFETRPSGRLVEFRCGPASDFWATLDNYLAIHHDQVVGSVSESQTPDAFQTTTYHVVLNGH